MTDFVWVGDRCLEGPLPVPEEGRGRHVICVRNHGKSGPILTLVRYTQKSHKRAQWQSVQLRKMGPAVDVWIKCDGVEGAQTVVRGDYNVVAVEIVMRQPEAKALWLTRNKHGKLDVPWSPLPDGADPLARVAAMTGCSPDFVRENSVIVRKRPRRGRVSCVYDLEITDEFTHPDWTPVPYTELTNREQMCCTLMRTIECLYGTVDSGTGLECPVSVDEARGMGLVGTLWDEERA